MEGGNIMSLGLRIIENFERLPEKFVKNFEALATANIGDVMGRLRSMDYTIKSMNKLGVHLVGNAITIRVHPTDNVMVYKAIELAQPGDVLVIDAFGGHENALVGELICTYAKLKGISGIVTSTPIRDSLAIYNMDFPVFARGATPRGPLKEGSGEINTIISCGNVPVCPGDIIVGDDDGIVVIPKEDAEDVLKQTKLVIQKEQQIMKEMQDKGTWKNKMIDEILERKGLSNKN